MEIQARCNSVLATTGTVIPMANREVRLCELMLRIDCCRKEV